MKVPQHFRKKIFKSVKPKQIYFIPGKGRGLFIFQNTHYIHIFLSFLQFFHYPTMTFIFPVFYVFPYDFTYTQLQYIVNQPENECMEPVVKNSLQFEKNRWNQYLEIFESYLLKKSKKHSKKVWTKEEDDLLLELRGKNLNWEEISSRFLQTNSKICKRRYERLIQTLLRWPQDLDNQIRMLYEVQELDWKSIHTHLYGQGSEKFPRHTLKQIKERYLLNLKPGINNEQWSVEEDLKLLRVIKEQGTHWRKISVLFIGRTQLQLKNRYYGTLKPLEKKVLRKLNANLKKNKIYIKNITQ